MALTKYKSKFETTMFKYVDESSQKYVMITRPPIEHDAFKDTGISVVQKSDSVFTLKKIDGNNSYLSSQFFRIPSFLLTKHDTLIASFDIRWNSATDIGMTTNLTTNYDQATGICRSTDYGRTWSNPECVNAWYYQDSSGLALTGASDPNMAYDEENDCIFHFSICGLGLAGGSPVSDPKSEPLSSAGRQQLGMSYSIDDGLTWSNPVPCFEQIENAEELMVGVRTNFFGGCSSGIVLKHQKNSANNGKILLPIQLWYSATDANSRSGLLELTPTYERDDDGKITKVNFAGKVISGFAGTNVTGASECSVCEDEYGRLVIAYRSYHNAKHNDPEYPNLLVLTYTKIAMSTDCGETWKVIGDVTNNTSEPSTYACSTLREAAKNNTSICYSEYTHSYYLFYELAISNRHMPMIRYSTDLLHWYVFDSVAQFQSGYGALRILNDKTKLGCIVEGPGNYNARYFTYYEYDLKGGKQITYSNSWVNLVTDTYSSGTISYRPGIQGFDFTIAAFTDKSQITIDSIGFSTADNVNSIIRVALFTKDAGSDPATYALVKDSFGRDAVSNSVSYLPNTNLKFVFSYPVTLYKGTKYYLTICATNAITNPANYSAITTNFAKASLSDYKGTDDLTMDVHTWTGTESSLIPASTITGNKLSPRVFVTEYQGPSFNTYSMIRAKALA